MSIKFKNARILTKDFSVIEGKDLVVEKNRIKSIVDTSSLDDNMYDRVIDCNGNVLIPGFKNAHTHNAMVFARSLVDDLPLNKWLYEKIYPLEDKMDEEDIHYFTILGVMENLSSGITACADMYKMNRVLAETYYELKYRVNLIESVTMYDKVIEPEERFIDLNNYKDDNHNLIQFTLGIHAEYTNNDNTLNLISNLVHKYKTPCFSHNSETLKEVRECKDRWRGLTPTEVQDKYGLYDYGGGGYHCIYFSKNDIEIFKKHNLTVITNPASNLKLASGIAPIKKYLDEGIKVAIGTDGPASNNAIDMFREMYLVSNLSKYIEANAVCISAKEILNMAITNSAHAMNMSDADCIEEGKLADIVMIDIYKSNLQPMNEFTNNLVYACGKQNVKLTMVDGNILYEDGKFNLCEKEEYIYNKCNKLLVDLKNR